MIATPTFVVNPSLVKKLPYDTQRDFAPISLAATSPHLLAVHPSLPVRSVKELIALGKARPGQLNYGSGGIGTTAHIAGEFLQSYRWLRKLVRPDRLSRELMQLQPQIERLRIVVYQPVVEPVGAMVVTTEVTYEYPQ